MNTKDRITELTEAHWDYHKTMIPCLAPFLTNEEICAFGAWYREIGKHFYNHALLRMCERGGLSRNGIIYDRERRVL